MISEKDSIELIIGIVAVIIGGVALTVGTLALAFVVGLKNSTHQVVWKDVEPIKEEDNDPFIYDPPIDENPNKKINPNKKKPAAEDDDLVDLDDPAVTSNDW